MDWTGAGHRAGRRRRRRILVAALLLPPLSVVLTGGGAGAAAGGGLDPSFGGDGLVTADFGAGSIDTAAAMVRQPDGKIVVAGSRISGIDQDMALARFNPNGSPDTTFGAGGRVLRGFGPGSVDVAHAVAVQPDGRLVVAGATNGGSGNDFAVARFNRDGSPDTSFDGDGAVTTAFGVATEEAAHALLVQPDGRILVAGDTFAASSDFALARYNANGSLDAGFGAGGRVTTDLGNNDHAYSIARAPDGKLVVAGEALVANADFAVARYQPSGSLDTTFDVDGKVTTGFPGSNIDSAYSVVLQPDGRIVLAGSSHNGADTDFALARYTANGTLDATFDGDGRVTTEFAPGGYDVGRAAVLQPDGKIVVAGYSDNRDFGVARYAANGTLDAAFDGDGRVTTDFPSRGEDLAEAVALQPDGRIVVAGTSFTAGSSRDFALARYLGDAGPGYWLVAADGGIFSFDAPFSGSTGATVLNRSIVGMAADPDGSGYWLVAADGGVFAFDAPFKGSLGGTPLNQPIVGMAADPDGSGYWLVAADGGVFAFDAPFKGSMGGRRLSRPLVGMAAAPDGSGYWLVASDGGVFAFGAQFKGAMGGTPLSQPIVGMAADPDGSGYFLVAANGGVFAFDAAFRGSMGITPLNRPMVGMAADPDGSGYWLVASDGGVFAFDAPFRGSVGATPLNRPVVGISAQL